VAPVVHGLEAEWQDEIDFIYLDIDDPNTEDFKRDLGFRYQPHFLLIDGDGMILQQWLGVIAAEELEAAFMEALQ
jgi:hypothetical protein